MNRLVGGVTALLAVTVVVAGSGFVGWRWAASVDREARQTFRGQASAIASAVDESLQRDADLTAVGRAVVQLQPHLTNSVLQQWFSEIGATTRYPGSMGIAVIQRVTTTELPAYEAAVAADPTSATAQGAFRISPAGAEPPYCFMRLLALNLGASQLAGNAIIPPGIDWCAASTSWAYSDMEDTGQFVVIPVLTTDYLKMLGVSVTGSAASPGAITALNKLMNQLFGSAVYIEAPVYAGVTPSTVAGRRGALVGWVGGMFDTSKILAGARGTNSGFQITLLRQNPGRPYEVLATSGRVRHPTGLQDRIGFTSDGKWEVAVTEPAGSWWQSGTAQGLLMGGTLALVGLLLLVTVLTLYRSRRKALALVDERTGELRHKALHDSLTGLPNRTVILDSAEQMLTRGRRSNSATALLQIDLDNFKDLNDTIGHAVGDALLKDIAARLTSVLRESDTVGRLEGDEFVVLTEGRLGSGTSHAFGAVEGAEGATGARLVAERILDALREPFSLSDAGSSYVMTASIGIATGDRESAEELLRDADVALHEAKAAGRNRYVFFRPEMHSAVVDRFDLESELRTAVSRKQLFLVYQPIFDLRTMNVRGLEALLRWRHPTRGVVLPMEFIPTLETSGMIVEVGRWVLAEACRQTRLWHDAGHLVCISANVSAVQFEAGDLVGDVRSALERSGLDPRYLVMEITESVLMRDPITMVDRLRELEGIGVRVAVDDFGTGYSSMAYLKQFPIDILKIDRSFVLDMMDSSEGAALVHTLVQLGKAVGFVTVAEGIEDEEQLERLRAEECDNGQGFYYSHPLEAPDAGRFMAEKAGPVTSETVSAASMTEAPPSRLVPASGNGTGAVKGVRTKRARVRVDAKSATRNGSRSRAVAATAKPTARGGSDRLPG